MRSPACRDDLRLTATTGRIRASATRGDHAHGDHAHDGGGRSVHAHARDGDAADAHDDAAAGAAAARAGPR